MSRRKRLRSAKRQRLAIALACFSVLVFWLIGLWGFSASMPQPNNSSNISRVNQTQADAVVVFTGANERLDTGFDLLNGNYAPKLFISGVYRGVEVASLVKNFSDPRTQRNCCVVVGYNAVNTFGNARESIEWFKQENIDSIILVTSSYHVPRSLYYLKQTSYPVQITIYPVLSNYADTHRWGNLPGTRDLIISEYNKYLLARIAGIFSSVDVDSRLEELTFTSLP